MDVEAWIPFEHSIINEANLEPSDDLLSATFRDGNFNDRIMIARPDLEYLEADLFVRKLIILQDSLWYAGLPRPPRPLHHQRLLRRQLVISEQMSLHLVWTHQHVLYVKPIPRYLLCKKFWMKHIVHPTHGSGDCAQWDGQSESNSRRYANIRECALGFLFSYTALVAYESDFRIARAEGLIPEEITWPAWKSFSRDLLNRHDYQAINLRFRYGELRLSRLNEICRYKHGKLAGYTSIDKHRLYKDFFQDNFGKIASVLGFVVVVLEALQVGLAARIDRSFEDFAWGFAIFAIVAPVFLLMTVIVTFTIAYWSNWRTTKAYHGQRLEFFRSAKLNGEKCFRSSESIPNV